MVRLYIAFILTLYAPISFAISGLEMYLAARLIDQGTKALFDSKDSSLSRPYTHTVAQRLNTSLPLSLSADLSITKTLALAPGLLEFHIHSTSFDAATLQEPQVLQKMNQTLGPYLRGAFCHPQSFWYARWLKFDGTLLVRVFASDGRLIQSYSAVQQDCQTRKRS